MDPVSRLTIDAFRDRVGQSFRDTEAGIAYDLRVVEDLTALARNVDPEARTPFSLVFRGPVDPVVAQSIRPLAHDELGELEIFLVPIRQDAEGTEYQAVFT